MKKLKYVKLFEDYKINEEGIFGNLFGGGKKEEPKSDPSKGAREVWKPLLDKFFPNNTFDIQDFNVLDPQKKESASNLYRFCELLRYHTEPDAFQKHYGSSLENFFKAIKYSVDDAFDYHLKRLNMDEQDKKNAEIAKGTIFNRGYMTEDEYIYFTKNSDGMKKRLITIKDQLLSFYKLYHVISTGEFDNIEINNQKLGENPFDKLNSYFTELLKNNEDASKARVFIVKFTKYVKDQNKSPLRNPKSEYDFTYLFSRFITYLQ